MKHMFSFFHSELGPNLRLGKETCFWRPRNLNIISLSTCPSVTIRYDSLAHYLHKSALYFWLLGAPSRIGAEETTESAKGIIRIDIPIYIIVHIKFFSKIAPICKLCSTHILRRAITQGIIHWILISLGKYLHPQEEGLHYTLGWMCLWFGWLPSLRLAPIDAKDHPLLLDNKASEIASYAMKQRTKIG